MFRHIVRIVAFRRPACYTIYNIRERWFLILRKNPNKRLAGVVSFAASFLVAVALALYQVLQYSGGSDDLFSKIDSVPVDPDHIASDIYSDSDFDYLAIHMRDLEDLDIDMLVGYQERAASLPDTADLDAISYRILNGNKPYFSDTLLNAGEFELYSDLDSLGRCGMAFANISPYTMPLDDQERGNISAIKPSGWHSVKMQGVDGGYLYNRCHLIGYQLAAENANKLNLITGTRHLNIQGMLGFENAVARYVRDTGNHVLYAVTPIFIDSELVARGVLIEAYSIEDGGKGICFCAFCYNNQPGVEIDYATGESRIA